MTTTLRVRRSASMVEPEAPPLVDLLDVDQYLQAGTCPLCALCDVRNNSPDLLQKSCFALWKYQEIAALVDALRPPAYRVQLPLHTKTSREQRLYFFGLLLRIAEYAEQWGMPIRLTEPCDDIRTLVVFWQLHTMVKTSVDDKPFVHEGKYGRLFVQRLNELVASRKTIMKTAKGPVEMVAEESTTVYPFPMACPPTFCSRHAVETRHSAPAQIPSAKSKKSRQPLSQVNTDGEPVRAGGRVRGEKLPPGLFTADEQRMLAGLSAVPVHLLERYISYRKSSKSLPRSPDPPALAPSTPGIAAPPAEEAPKPRSRKRQKTNTAPAPMAYPVAHSPAPIPPGEIWYQAPSPASGYGTPGPMSPHVGPGGWMGPPAPSPGPMTHPTKAEESPKNDVHARVPKVWCQPYNGDVQQTVLAAGITKTRIGLTVHRQDRVLTSILRHMRSKFAKIMPMQPHWNVQLHLSPASPPMPLATLAATTVGHLMAAMEPPETELALFYSWGPDPPAHFAQPPTPPLPVHMPIMHMPAPMPMPTASELGQGEGWELAGTEPAATGGYLDLDLSLGGFLDGQVSLGLSSLPPVPADAVSEEVLSEEENSPKAPHPTSPQEIGAAGQMPQFPPLVPHVQQQNKRAGGSYPDVSVDGFGLQLHGTGQPAGRQSGMGSVLRSNSISFKQPVLTQPKL